jgi:hypothetical protein
MDNHFTYILYLKSASANHCHGRSNLLKDLEMCVRSYSYLLVRIINNVVVFY